MLFEILCIFSLVFWSVLFILSIIWIPVHGIVCDAMEIALVDFYIPLLRTIAKIIQCLLLTPNGDFVLLRYEQEYKMYIQQECKMYRFVPFFACLVGRSFFSIPVCIIFNCVSFFFSLYRKLANVPSCVSGWHMIAIDRGD
jgi:hypothetical protein